MRVASEAVIAADPATVYALIAEPRARTGWLPELRDVDAASGPVQVGSEFTGTSRVLLHDLAGRSLTTVADAPRAISEEVIVGVRLRSTWQLHADSPGTSVRHIIEIVQPSIWVERLVLAWWLRRMQRRSLSALQRHVTA